MTMQSTLPLNPLNSSLRAAIQRLARQALIPLSRTAFVRNRNCFLKQGERTTLILAGHTRLIPALVSRKPLLTSRKLGIEIPSNSTWSADSVQPRILSRLEDSRDNNPKLVRRDTPFIFHSEFTVRLIRAITVSIGTV
jgi:hypothetical protein